MKTHLSRTLSGFLFIATSVLFLGGFLCLGETHREVCRVQQTWVERKQDGPVDYKVFYCVTGTMTQAVVTVECYHRAPGASDWLIRVGITNSSTGKADKRLVVGAILLAMDSLHRDYSLDPVGEVCLDATNLPMDFLSTFYQTVSAQMRRLDSKAMRFDDPKVRKMVRDAYQKMDFARYIQACLREEGFTVKIDTAELCCLQRYVEGMTWKDISNEPFAGLNVKSAPCCFSLERTGDAKRRVDLDPSTNTILTPTQTTLTNNSTK